MCENLRINNLKYKDMLRICAALILFLLTTSYSFAFESKTALIKAGEKLTLSDCIQIALDNSPNIKRAAYNYKISKNDVSIAKASFFPTLSVGTGYYYNGTYAKSRDINSNYYSANAGLNQLIWNFGKTNSQIKMQKFNKIAALYNFDNTVIDTIFNVKTNYYGVLAAKATMDINKANVDINERNYLRTKAYFEEHGDLNVPVEYIVNGVWLNKWLNEQKIIGEGRRKNKSLSEEQKSRLKAIGMQFGVSKVEQLWQQNFEELKRFYEQNGHINVPKNHLTSDGKKLNVWVQRQRVSRQNGTLSDEQITLLDDVGMEWRNIADAAYETGFEHLETYIAEHNTSNIPLNTECQDGYKLGRWLSNCKTKYRSGKLPKKHITHFEQLGVQLEKSDAWEERFREVKAFIEKNGDTYIPKGTYSESGHDLFLWASDQRKFDKKGMLSEERKS